MKDSHSIEEQDLDGALNALFLEAYSIAENEEISGFVFEQKYEVNINSKKEAELLKKLAGKPKGGSAILWISIALLLIVSALFFFTFKDNKQTKAILAEKQTQSLHADKKGSMQKDGINLQPVVVSNEPKINNAAYKPVEDSTQSKPQITEPQSTELKQDSIQKEPEKKNPELPFFNKEGLAYFAKIKEQVLKSILTIDDRLYAKIEPGVTMYKGKEVLVDPFVMRNFAITNLEYKTFLADLAGKGKMDELMKAMPKGNAWKENGCVTLAKDYFEEERYNNFPVVNVSKEGALLFCGWLQAELNDQPQKKSNTKKRDLVVRLPYDHEWIYSAEAAYTLVSKCDGYNTIYDPSDGLVDNNFYKRTSSLRKHDKSLATRMDELSDVNRYDMTEPEIIKIFREAIMFNDQTIKTSSGKEPEYPLGIEACSEAGHVSEIVQDLDNNTKVMGCCWKSKEDYLKMLAFFDQNKASPFVGFRLVITNKEKGTYKNPFW